MTGGAGADSLVGSNQANTLNGGPGADTIVGAGGATPSTAPARTI